jgi:hypothetical protein
VNIHRCRPPAESAISRARRRSRVIARFALTTGNLAVRRYPGGCAVINRQAAELAAKAAQRPMVAAVTDDPNRLWLQPDDQVGDGFVIGVGEAETTLPITAAFVEDFEHQNVHPFIQGDIASHI